MLCNGADGQILSVGGNKTIKVWDIFSYKCVQTLHDPTTHYPENQLTCACLDPERRRLLTVGSNLSVWAQDTNPERMLQAPQVMRASKM